MAEKENVVERVVNLPSEGSVLTQKVQLCLNVIDQLTPMVTVYPDGDSFSAGKSVPLKWDGGATQAALNTFGEACHRLDKILADDKLWRAKTPAKQLEKFLLRTHEAQMVHTQANAEQAIHQCRACVRMGARVTLGADNLFYVYTGKLEDENNRLIASGRSVDEAMDAFDRLANPNS